jgi:hypothetical protein
MKKYTAQVSFNVYEFEADSTKNAIDKVDELINELTTVKTELTWDDVDFIVREE